MLEVVEGTEQALFEAGVQRTAERLVSNGKAEMFEESQDSGREEGALPEVGQGFVYYSQGQEVPLRGQQEDQEVPEAPEEEEIRRTP